MEWLLTSATRRSSTCTIIMPRSEGVEAWVVRALDEPQPLQDIIQDSIPVVCSLLGAIQSLPQPPRSLASGTVVLYIQDLLERSIKECAFYNKLPDYHIACQCKADEDAPGLFHTPWSVSAMDIVVCPRLLCEATCCQPGLESLGIIR